MSNFNFHIGFDWNAAAQNGTLPLTLALETFTTPAQSGPNYSFTAPTDYVCFNALNMTSGAQIQDYSIIGGEITFNPVGTQSGISPFNLQSMEIGSIGQATGTTQLDTFLNGSGPYWAPVVPLLQVFTQGTFGFTIKLMVQKTADSSIKNFRTDPEMIVWGPGN